MVRCGFFQQRARPAWTGVKPWLLVEQASGLESTIRQERLSLVEPAVLCWKGSREKSVVLRF